MTRKEKRVNQALDDSVPMKHPLTIHEAKRYSLLAGGKRVRPILSIAACELVGGNEEMVMPIAFVSSESVVRAIAELGAAVSSDELVASQIMDIESAGKEVNLKHLEYIHVHKTAKLLEASVVCGAIVGVGNKMEKDLATVKATYSRLMGIEKTKGFADQVVKAVHYGGKNK
ncbi:hypothetical protein MKW94_008718 [Papaver nudicaule]|uniref:Uncharacterized protein n=1 Tax=Papaver nudicaule TaxID=74823 RepID=A0AA41VIA8_PAPNU|nr:hypothetical protein [Papaver nudicaule]